eukprot:UN34124
MYQSCVSDVLVSLTLILYSSSSDSSDSSSVVSSSEVESSSQSPSLGLTSPSYRKTSFFHLIIPMLKFNCNPFFFVIFKNFHYDPVIPLLEGIRPYLDKTRLKPRFRYSLGVSFPGFFQLFQFFKILTIFLLNVLH